MQGLGDGILDLFRGLRPDLHGASIALLLSDQPSLELLFHLRDPSFRFLQQSPLALGDLYIVHGDGAARLGRIMKSQPFDIVGNGRSTLTSQQSVAVSN